MSVSATIGIGLALRNKKRCPAIEIISTLTAHGWEIFQNKEVSYQPLGTTDIGPWQHEITNFEKIESIFSKKEQQKEVNGIIMHWRNTDISASFLFPTEQVSFKTFSVNLHGIRPKIKMGNNYEATDFQWYLERILPPLDEAFGVEYFSCEEHR